MKAIIFGSKLQSDKKNLIKEILGKISKGDFEIIVFRQFYEFIKSFVDDLSFVSRIIEEGEDFDADIAFSIGGDGTYLLAAHKVGIKKIPIVGVNTGRLGFLADWECLDLDSLVGEKGFDNSKICELTTLRLEVDGRIFDKYPYALNEVAILKSDSSSMLEIHATLDGEYLNGYQGDGLIIATPTGSSAYSLSVGGPLMMPDSKNILVVAVAPHNLTTRPIVINETSSIELEVCSRGENFFVALDGKSFKLKNGTKLKIRKAENKIYTVRRKNYTFIKTLQRKMMWGVDPRSKD